MNGGIGREMEWKGREGKVKEGKGRGKKGRVMEGKAREGKGSERNAREGNEREALDGKRRLILVYDQLYVCMSDYLLLLSDILAETTSK